MTDITLLQQKNDRMFILICLNFAMLFILFCGLGYVLWQSNELVSDLKLKLRTAEESVAEIKERVQQIDLDTAVDRIMASAAGKIEASVKDALEQSELNRPLQNLSEKVENTQKSISQVSESLNEISNNLQNIDAEQLAQLVSYKLLKGLGEGFTEAAESREPDM